MTAAEAGVSARKISDGFHVVNAQARHA